MMHKAWSSIEEVPCCFARSFVKFQGRMALKIVEFDTDWAFPDCNSSLNSPMATKCCTKLEVAQKRCSIVFQGHPSNFKVTRDNISPMSTRIERFWTVNAVWIHQWIWMMHKAWRSIEEVPYCFSRSSIKFHGHTGGKIDDLNPVWDY